jgi:hypothetical protein
MPEWEGAMHIEKTTEKGLLPVIMSKLPVFGKASDGSKAASTAELGSETNPKAELDSGISPGVELDSETTPKVELDSETIPRAELGTSVEAVELDGRRMSNSTTKLKRKLVPSVVGTPRQAPPFISVGNTEVAREMNPESVEGAEGHVPPEISESESEELFSAPVET